MGEGKTMKKLLLIAAALATTLAGGCATYSDGYGGYSYGPWVDGYYFYDGRGDGHHRSRTRGGRSEPGNEAGMYPGRPGDGRGQVGGGVGSGRGDARGGEAGR